MERHPALKNRLQVSGNAELGRRAKAPAESICRRIWAQSGRGAGTYIYCLKKTSGNRPIRRPVGLDVLRDLVGEAVFGHLEVVE
jgi:hypothetical protein